MSKREILKELKVGDKIRFFYRGVFHNGVVAYKKIGGLRAMVLGENENKKRVNLRLDLAVKLERINE